MKIFSVIDVETTGFNPKGGDRIVEIGIVKIDEEGNIIDIYETLINPERNVGPAHIHGISGKMVMKAPKFDEVLYDIYDFVNGTYAAAHNSDFDFGFLNSETKRFVDSFTLKGICTLKIARKLLPALPSRSLGYLADYFGIESGIMHSAGSDAMTAARLLILFFRKYNYRPDPEQCSVTQIDMDKLLHFRSSSKILKRSDFI